ncbi:hypothetical protein [Hydrogenivirga caldilitoris]|nr:hypothetical protein [Hydrogenivirga caldilitoris]
MLALPLLLVSCDSKPSVKSIEKELEGKYRFFGDVEDVRILSMVKVKEDTYFVQVTYGIKFKRSIGELEKDISEKLKDANLYKSLSLFVNIVALNELVNRCGRIYIEKGRTCYLTDSFRLVRIKGSWVIQR